MELAEFDYHLPPELIAQEPLADRSTSRLMVIRREDASLTDAVFQDIEKFLPAPSLLVLNDSRVIPARIYCHKAGTGGRVEILLTRKVSPLCWEALVRPSRRLQPGTRLIVDKGVFECTILERSPLGGRLLELHYDGDFWDLLGRYGKTPLPPYIKKTLQDDERYQTVYARERGSVAAPTAGLHFTPELIARLKRRGIDHASVTLHIGPGTFRQVKCDRVEDHVMDHEYYALPPETLQKVAEAKKRGVPVIAVGTTAVRTLESVFACGMEARRLEGSTGLFIYPGYSFRIVDHLITNFHLPRSTLLMLVSAFGGTALVKRAYQQAVEGRYRFYSLGDAMLIV